MKSDCNYIIFLLIFISCASDSSNDTIKPSLSNITESVYASASVVPKDTYYSRSSKSGIIRNIYVKEGDHVVKGQSLFKISPTADYNNRLINAEISLEEAKSNYSGKNNLLKNIELEIRTAKERNTLDSINYTRQERLWNQKIGSRHDLESSLLIYQESTNKIKSLNNQFNQNKINLKNNYDKAKNLVATERSQLGDFKIKSEIEGKVFSIYKKEGEFITPQENFGEIGNVLNYIIELDIDEVDISKIEIGDTAIIILEAYPDETYTSILSYISNKKNENTQTFNVESYFLKPPPKLYNGLSGEANIVINRRENILIIPSEYLFNNNKVLTSEGEINVKIGIKNLEYVEIIEGIDTSTTLIKPN